MMMWRVMTVGERLSMAVVILAVACQGFALVRGSLLVSVVCGFLVGFVGTRLYWSLKRPKGQGI